MAHPKVGAAAIHARWSTIKRWVKIGLAVLFVTLGVLGLFLPVLQGILFLAVGVSLLASEIPWVERQMHALRRRHPRAVHAFDSAEHWLGVRWRGLRRRGRSLLTRLRGEKAPD